MTRLLRAFVVMLFASVPIACSSSARAVQVPATPPPASVTPSVKWGMVIHTGAGNFTVASVGDRIEPERAAMNEALTAGYKILANGGTGLDAEQAAIVVMEDSPLFNAGKGAVFTHEGTNELDAAIMDGSTMKAGAVAGLKHIKNPTKLARLVMDKSPHVMLAGEGAVALDQHGNLAAGTSTGSLTDKRLGRIGDSPIIGAGTYANNASCAISSTGIGEFWIRYTVAHDICARVQYKQRSLQSAADALVQTTLKPIGGEGGVIGLDEHGTIAMSFNTSGMGRGYIGPDGTPVVMFTDK